MMGDKLDLHLADLLTRYGIKGTFYVSQHRQEHLTDLEIQHIAKENEIGAHTLTHGYQIDEIKASKKWLESLGDEVKMFCYPKGQCNADTVSAVIMSGFKGARTTKLGSIISLPNNFLMETTLQVYPFPFRKLNKKQFYLGRLIQPFLQRAPSLRKLGVSTRSMFSWSRLAKTTFDIALEKGEVFHLWGHSWEIEKYGMWDELEEFLQYISGRADCSYVTNYESIK